MRGAPETWMQEKAEEAARILGVEEILDRRAGTLSSGQMRRVLVARALVHDPGTLLLDEPYTSLDIAARHSFSGEGPPAGGPGPYDHLGDPRAGRKSRPRWAG
ncbi:MAG: ATP-binding cassette domain-containing protein [Candidatus Moduliflexus flocculans]|nr:ATP-binding cassette domain-containing protein [Candidatus Moduliflexus flocculans]